MTGSPCRVAEEVNHEDSKTQRREAQVVRRDSLPFYLRVFESLWFSLLIQRNGLANSLFPW